MESRICYNLQSHIIRLQVQIGLQSRISLSAFIERSYLGQWLTIEHLYRLLQAGTAQPRFCLEDLTIEVDLKIGPSSQTLYVPILDLTQSQTHQIFTSAIHTVDSLIKMAEQQTIQEEQKLKNQIQQQTDKYSQYRDGWFQSQRTKKQHEQQLGMLSEEVMKLNKQIVVLDQEILGGKRGLERQRYKEDTQGEKLTQRKRKVYLNELVKMGHPKIQNVVREGGAAQRIDLSQCELRSMKFVEIFEQLQDLQLPCNAIKRMEGLGGLTHLRKLNLAHNQIERLDGLGSNLQLRELNLQSNKLGKLQNVFHLTRLQILSLSNNHLQEIPRQISCLQAIIQLKVINNSLSSLPWELTGLRKLRTLSLLGNPCFSTKSRAREVIERLVCQQVVTCCGSP